VTSVCGEVQHLKRAVTTMGVKSDLEIFRLLAGAMDLDLGACTVDSVQEEIRRREGRPIGARTRPDLIRSAGDTLFTSGTLGRYSKALSGVTEAPGGLYRWNS
jgi:NADH-quinone oxidoreductase subunit G